MWTFFLQLIGLFMVTTALTVGAGIHLDLFWVFIFDFGLIIVANASLKRQNN